MWTKQLVLKVFRNFQILCRRFFAHEKAENGDTQQQHKSQVCIEKHNTASENVK